MTLVIKVDELIDWIELKGKQDIMNSTEYMNGYLDALDNLIRDIQEKRLPVHVFEGTESDLKGDI